MKYFSKIIHFFTREEISYTNAKIAFGKVGLASKIQVHLDHDTSLTLTRTDIVDDYRLSNRYRLIAFRRDKEATSQRAPSRGYLCDPVMLANSFETWVDIHAQSKSIVTNRLHSAIVGSILGKPVILLPNSYFKNRAVYDYSLQHRGVSWLDYLDCSRMIDKVSNFSGVRRIRSSIRLQRCFLNLQVKAGQIRDI